MAYQLDTSGGEQRRVFARRGYGQDRYGSRHLTTFVSEDEADNRPLGWVQGWFEDGAQVGGWTLTHVYTPSWRVSDPQQLPVEKAA